jgi:hypothetical protein
LISLNRVQHGNYHFILGLDTEHDSERMQDVRLASPVLLALVGFDRDGDGFFEQ